MVGAAAVLILVAWFALLWSPKGADLADARERRAAAEDQVDQLQLRLGKLEAASRQGPALQSAADRVRGAVPDTADLAGLVLAVNDAAGQSKVQLLSIIPSPTVTSSTGGPNEIPLAMSVSGDYVQMLGFLDRLLDLPRIVVLDTVGVTSSQIDDRVVLNLSMTGRTFTREAVAAPAGPGTATVAPSTIAPSTTAPSTTGSSTPTMVP
jgi:Tfp pilus assembly protein PilO